MYSSIKDQSILQTLIEKVRSLQVTLKHCGNTVTAECCAYILVSLMLVTNSSSHNELKVLNVK